MLPSHDCEAWRNRLRHLRGALTQHDIPPDVRDELEREIAQIEFIITKFEGPKDA